MTSSRPGRGPAWLRPHADHARSTRWKSTSANGSKTTFGLVDQQFQRYFDLFFEGGKAHLTLTVPDDMANTGIDILRPAARQARQHDRHALRQRTGADGARAAAVAA